MVRVAPATSVPSSTPSGRRSFAVAIARASSALLLVLLVAVPRENAEARSFSDAVGTIRTSALPEEGRQVLAAIHAGGPFVSRRDGIPFGNREGMLPRHERGYYAEFTVPTPGERTRGARRIIAGRGRTGDFRTSDEYYYTNDHYETFRRILE